MKKVGIVRLTGVVGSFRGIGHILLRSFHNFCATVSMFMSIFLLLFLIVAYSCQCALGEDFPPPESLFRAIEEGDHNAVQQLINAGVDVNSRNGSNESPLHFAAKKGDVRIVKSLLDAGADTDAKVSRKGTPLHGTPLHVAASFNHVEVIKLLLQTGTDVDIRSGNFRGNTNFLTNNGYTPLHRAIDAGRFEAAECLIQAGADVNMGETETEDRFTPLISAVEKRHLNIIKLLLDNNADVNLPMNGGATPLHFAVGFRSFEGSFEAVSLLVEHKAKLDLKVTPLIYVQGENANKIYSILVQSGATTGKPLLDAVLLGDTAKIDALLEGEANINIRENFTKNTALHFAVKARNADIAEILIDKGIDINAKNNNDGFAYQIGGFTPLHIAVQNKDIVLAKLLIDSKADVNAADADKCTALHLAIEEKCDDIVELLINAKADVNSTTYSYTPLASAVLHPRPKIVELLIEAGADVNLLSYKKIPSMARTPLDLINSHAPLNSEESNIKKMLLAAGAKTSKDVLTQKNAESNIETDQN